MKKSKGKSGSKGKSKSKGKMAPVRKPMTMPGQQAPYSAAPSIPAMPLATSAKLGGGVATPKSLTPKQRRGTSARALMS